MAASASAAASGAGTESPLIQALPPASDYLTYLTIVEYNLTVEALPVLHSVLQDENLATNIGWDLVHLLLPLLPDSELCLQDVARLGNPREVILKVSESLRLVQYDCSKEYVDHDDDILRDTSSSTRVRADSSTFPLKTASTVAGDSRPGSSQAIELPPPPPLAINQFCTLLSMLTVLHPRIKTKHPSRFLSTSLQAILASFSDASTHREDLILAIVKFIETVSGIKQTSLSDRKGGGTRTLPGSLLPALTSAGDPEAADIVEHGPEEAALQLKLLQSFVTHTIEEYMLNLKSDRVLGDIPGMAWSGRIVERTRPRRVIPGRQTFADRFANEGRLRGRIDAFGRLVNLAEHLGVTDAELLSATTVTQDGSSQVGDHSEDEPPESAEDIPLSRLGSLMLYTARSVSTILAETASVSNTSVASIFPDHEGVLKHCISAPAYGAGSVGTEPETLIDAVIAFGLVSLHNKSIGRAQNEEQFNEYLQVLALISSNCPSSVLRGHAHILTTSVLQAQPDELKRLAFIRDTLEHCPFENLKVSAVGWIKDEIIKAMATSSSGENKSSSIFSTSLPLTSLAPFLFPRSLKDILITSPVEVGYLTFRTNLSLYLAILNFLYLLLSLPRDKQELLKVSKWWTDAEIQNEFLLPLRAATGVYKRDIIDDKGDWEDQNSSDGVSETIMVEEVLDRVETAMGGLLDD